MSNYNIQIAWSGKDALSDSDPNKIISGDDFNTEFTAVQTAINSKAELAGNSGQDFSCNDLTITGGINGSTGIVTNGDITAGNDGSGNLKWGSSGANVVGTNATGTKTVSTSDPTGGSDGDVWYKVSA
jgi:hypothetical protein